MSHEPQDKRIVDSRSDIGSMNFNQIRKFIGVDVNPDDLEDESGTSVNLRKGKSKK